MKRSYAYRLRHTMTWPVIVSLPLFPLSLRAEVLPTGGVVAAGTATISKPVSGALLIRQATPRAVINWADFSIGRGNSVTFVQPDAAASTLNIVKGNAASVLGGTLKANGSVLLINQNGITITPDGLVDTRTGFIASGLGLSETDYMAGRLLFGGKGAAVLNQGRILTGEAGAVALLGSTVSNEGLIRAPLGKVALGAGAAATLDLNGDGFLQVMLPAGAVAADGQALISNSGVIQADGGSVVLKASTVRQALRDAVNMPGAIQARSISGHNGAVVLEGGPGGAVQVAGTVDVSAAAGATAGGIIAITGDSVALRGATLNAAGTERGGLVQVGGAFQGGRAQDPASAQATLFGGRFGAAARRDNASSTLVDAASSIDVSATGDKGVGGTAIVWSDKTTDMQGSIAARGALSGGAVEISSAALVRSVALKRVGLGKGGTLLLDPQDILIDSFGSDPAGDVNYAGSPGATTHLLDTDLTALLSTGATVNLQASQDISWLDNNPNLTNNVTRTPSTPGGNLNLSAGRSVTLSGIFNTADGNWSVIANDSAAHGVVDAERGVGTADIDLHDAHFILSNGKLSLNLADGAGNSNRTAGRISIGYYMGDSLTAAIAPTAEGDYAPPSILLSGDIGVAGAISLTGDLRTSSQTGTVALSGKSVTWTTEKTGGTINGEGRIQFVENGVLTRIGALGFRDAVRLALGDADVVGATRVYGDREPSIAELGTPQLHVAAHSTADPGMPIPFDTLLVPGSLNVYGPGPQAPAGSGSTLSVAGSQRAAFTNGSYGYFLDLTQSAPIPLTITKRSLTPTAWGASYTYGGSATVASLSNVVNGDYIELLATLNGTPNVLMSNEDTGYGFGTHAPAGVLPFTVTGLNLASQSAPRAVNYTLDVSGAPSATLNIARKAVTYAIPVIRDNGGRVYGDSGGELPYPVFSGLVNFDSVYGDITYTRNGMPVAESHKMPAGTYSTSVVALTGIAKDNYFIAADGNTNATYVVAPRPLHLDNSSAAHSTYGTAATVSNSLLLGPLGIIYATGQGYQKIGVLAGDDVQMQFAQGPFTANTPADTYSLDLTRLSGAAAGNYTIATPQPSIRLTVDRKPITYTGGSSTLVYGQGAVPAPILNGVVGTDVVTTNFKVDNTATWQGSGNMPVGEYSVSASLLGGPAASNYVLATVGNTKGVVTVTPKPITFDFLWKDTESTYGTLATVPLSALAGKVGADDVSGSMRLATGPGALQLTPTTDAGSYTIHADKLIAGADAGNYMLVGGTASSFALTINRKPVTFAVANAIAPRSVYGDALPSFDVALQGVLPGDTVGAATSITDVNHAPVTGRLNVGEYLVSATALTGARASNYQLSYGSEAPWRITPRPLTINAIAPVSAVYGTLAADGAVTFDNLVAGDSASARIVYMGLAPGGYAAPAERSPAGVYYPEAFALVGSPNYVLTVTSHAPFGALTIAPKPVTFSTPNATSFYGIEAVLGAGSLLGGVLPGDDVRAGATALESGLVPGFAANVGNYPLFPTLVGQQARNYAATSSGSAVGTLAIAPAVISYGVDLYNGAQWLAPSAYDEANGHSAPRVSSVYGALAPALEARPYVYAVSGRLVSNDMLSLTMNASTLPLSTSGNIAVGTYSWTAGALTGNTSNYVFAPAAGSVAAVLAITPAPVLVTPQLQQAGAALADHSAEYGSTGNISVLASLQGVQGRNGTQDKVGAAVAFAPAGGATAIYSGATLAGRQSAGSYDVVVQGNLTGADSANYVASVIPTTFVIKPKEVTIAAAEQRWTYGSTLGLNDPNVTNASIAGMLPGDRLTAVLAAYDGLGAINLRPQTNAGKYTINPIGISGEDAGNYFFTAFGQASYSPANQSNTLTILPRSLRVSSPVNDVAITYGDYVTRDVTIAGGVLFNDDVKATAQARSRDGTFQPVNGTLLDAGSYGVEAGLSGYSAGNYVVTYTNGTYGMGRIDVAKRALTFPLAMDNVAYGTTIDTKFHPGNIVPGQNLWLTYEVDNLYSGQAAPTTNGRYEVGTYAFKLKNVEFGSMANYTLGDSVLTIVPKVLAWAPAANSSATYGTLSAIPYATLSGVMAGDEVRVLSNDTRPLSLSAGAVATPAGLQQEATLTNPLRFAPFIAQDYRPGNPKTFYFTDNPDAPVFDVGAHTVNVSTDGKLVGSASRNYQLAATAGSTVVTIMPKPVSVGYRQVQYGYYQACDSHTCSPWGKPYAADGYSDFNAATLQGVVQSDYAFNAVNGYALRATVSYLDANGKSITIDATTPVGRYTQVVTGLQGAHASNYMVAGSGPLDVVPMWLSYATTSAIYLNGVGLVGKPGIASLRGPNGVAGINGDDVYAATVVAKDPNGKAVRDLTNLIEGRYQFEVTALGGKNAANYRILPYNNDDFRINAIEKLAYSSNDVGTLDVFANTGFGLNRVGTATLPIVPPYSPPMPPGRADASDLNDPFPQAGAKDFERGTTTTGTTASTATSATSATAIAGATGATERSTGLGGATLSGQASGSASAGATVGPAGAKATATADAHVDATVRSGDGFASAGAQANASVDVGVDKNGVSVDAQTSASASAQGGAKGSLGSAGTGSISSTVTAVASAESKNEAGLKDGKVSFGADNSAGVGVSAGVTGGISGGTGSVNAGATVYSPGSFGGGASMSAAYTDSGLSLGLDLGVKLGLGGVRLKFDFTIDREKFEGAFAPLITILGGTAYKKPTPEELGRDALAHADSLGKDPLARMSFLKSNDDWKNAPAASGSLSKAKADLAQFDSVLNAYPDLVRRQQETQATLLRLLATDPAAAVAFAHSDNFRSLFSKEETAIPVRAELLGLKYVVTDGTMSIKNR